MAPPRKYSSQQVELMIDCLQANPDMANSSMLNGSVNLKVLREKWDVLSQKLNSVPGGPTKTTEGWRKFWIEWRYKCKKKAANLKRYPPVPGSSRNRFQPFDELELRSLELSGISPVTLEPLADQIDTFPGDSDSNSETDTKNVLHTNASANTDIASVPKYVPIKPKPSTNSSIVFHDVNDNSHTESTSNGGEAWTWPTLVDGGDDVKTPIENKRKRKSITEDDSCPSPPKWALDLERRRIDAQERMADAMHSIATFMRTQEERRATTDERIADSLTAIAGTIQDMHATLIESIRHRLHPPE